MIKIDDKEKCCGCSSCFNICPTKAIKMVEDELTGFRYPEVDETQCINCGLCELKCPIISPNVEKENDICAYACFNNEEEVRMKSSSGGVFSLIAEYILENQGVVYGVAFDGKFETCHIRITDKHDLDKIRGSKYIQSDLNTSYTQAKNDLDEGKKVLFTGTPCQVEGFKKFLGKDYDNLILQDCICHGVPSVKVWRKYLEYRKVNDEEDVERIFFRSKENNGWDKYEVSFKYPTKEINIFHAEDKYMKIFLKDMALRDSCYKCSFRKRNREADITLADFWGIDNVLPEINDNKGISLLIVSSRKGKEIFEQISSKMNFVQVDFDKAIEYNPSMLRNPKKYEKRQEFFEKIGKETMEKILGEYNL